MSIGSSGRIVIEVDPATKRDLYSALAKDGLTLKDWFLQNTASYLVNHRRALVAQSEKQGDNHLSDGKSK